jgi:hypothetical protein
MDEVGLIEIIIVFSLIIVLPLIWIRIRGDKESSQYQERPSQDWKGTVEYREGQEYLKVMRHDKEPEKNEKKEE